MKRQSANTSQAMTTVLLVVVAGTIISVALVSAAIVSSSSANNASSMKVVGFQVYWDAGCTNPVKTLNWGTLEPNTTMSFTVYIMNTGTIPERLSMKTSNWRPNTVRKYVALTWNCEDTGLKPGSNITATFKLEIYSNIGNLADFSFDTIITGTQLRL